MLRSSTPGKPSTETSDDLSSTDSRRRSCDSALRREAIVSPQIAQSRAAIEKLCRDHHVQRLELFGSAATGQDRPGKSDLDFLVEFEQLPAGAYANAYFGLLESLQRLFERPVDLVVASAIQNPYFRQAVDRSKTLLYAA